MGKLDMILVHHSHVNEDESLLDVFRKLEMDSDCAYYYTAWQYNCQNFVHNFLMFSVNQKQVLELYDGFYYQPQMRNYFGDGTYNGHLATAVSSVLVDVGAKLTKIFSGEWIKRKKKKKKSDAHDAIDNEYYYDDDVEESYKKSEEYLYLRGYLKGMR